MENTKTLILLVALAGAPAWTFAAKDLDTLVPLAAKYESGASAEPLREIERWVNDTRGDAKRSLESEKALLLLLAPDATYEAKRFSCMLLAVVGTEASLPALAELLKSEETVGLACYTLCQLASSKGGDLLRAALPSSQGVGRLQLIDALGRRGEVASVVPLAERARDADVELARAAIRALGMIDDPSARAAVAAIRLAGRSEVSADWAAASLKGAEHLLAAGERPAVIALCEEVLQGKPPAHIRRGAFGLLLRCDADDGAKRVQELLSAATPDPVLSEVALARIAEMRGEGISDTFGALLPKLQPDQQVLLVESLACRGDVRARVAIQTRVFGSDPRVRRTAIQAVGKLEGESAVPLLVNALTRSSSAEETKEIQLALASLQGADKTDQALCAALGQAAAKDKPSLMTTLARRGSASAVSSLLGYACGDDKDLAHAAMQALTRLADGGDAAALAALQQALASDDAAVRNAALRTLTAWRGSAAWDSLVGALKDPKSEGGRTLALRGLVRLAGEGNAKPDAALIGRYRQLLEVARDDGERKLILNTLAGASHPDALALALPLLDVPGVREEAVQTVKRIAEAIQKKHPKAAEEAFAKIKGLG